MTFSNGEVIGILGFALTLASICFAFFKWIVYLDKQQTDKRDELSKDLSVKVTRAHERIDVIQGEFIKREELMANLNRIEATVTNSSQHMDERLDNLYTAIVEFTLKLKDKG